MFPGDGEASCRSLLHINCDRLSCAEEVGGPGSDFPRLGLGFSRIALIRCVSNGMQMHP